MAVAWLHITFSPGACPVWVINMPRKLCDLQVCVWGGGLVLMETVAHGKKVLRSQSYTLVS